MGTEFGQSINYRLRLVDGKLMLHNATTGKEYQVRPKITGGAIRIGCFEITCEAFDYMVKSLQGVKIR